MKSNKILTLEIMSINIRNMLSLPCLVLLILLISMFLFLNILIAEEGIRPVVDTNLGKHVEYSINKIRYQKQLPNLETYANLQKFAEKNVKFLARKFQLQPRDRKIPRELSFARIKKIVPEASNIFLEVSSAGSKEELIKQCAKLKLSRRKEATHMGIGTCRLRLRKKNDIYMMVAIGIQVPHSLNDEVLNAGHSVFRTFCHLCEHKFAVRMRKTAIEDLGSLRLKCPSCKLHFDIFARDEEGHYHRPTWFMEGFKPAELKRPLTAWLFVLKHCRYVKDDKLFGKKDIWQLAKDTFRRRRGDCEDVSILLADWLISAGYDARVVVGKFKNQGHAWVVLHRGDRDYILEATGTSRSYRRIPPRANLLQTYFPRAQFDDQDIWFRTDSRWTSNYDDSTKWSAGYWPN